MSQPIPLDFWWPRYRDALFILSNTFEPGKDFTKTQMADAMKCFIISITKLLSDDEIRNKWMNFIIMTKDVANSLLVNLPRFFSVYPQFAKAMIQDGPHFLNLCAESKETMFLWVYLFNAYMNIIYNRQALIPSLNEMKKQYDPSKLSKYDWGRPLWFIIHMSALYAPHPVMVSFETYKSLLNCLQYLLPCPKCRAHLRENLNKINIDRCAKTNEALFNCSVDLHNIVNVSKDNPTRAYSYEESRELYNPISTNRISTPSY
jgi:hypothetical protein